MIQISFYDVRTTNFIKQWPNWSGIVPVIGDMVVLHYGDDNKEEQHYFVRFREISGTCPEHIKLFIENTKFFK